MADTLGIHHLGLTVSRLEESARFFIDVLGWREVRRLSEPYPVIFISDGTQLLTLWQAENPETATDFDRRRNLGLHHLALAVGSEEVLSRVFQRVKDSGARIEFAPESLGGGPARHTMFYEPSGIRLELTWVPPAKPAA